MAPATAPMIGLRHGPEPGERNVEVVDQEGGVRLAGRAEIGIDAEMQLQPVVQAKPESAAPRKSGRLVQLLETQQLGPEPSCFGFAAGRHRDLHVVETDNHSVYNGRASNRRHERNGPSLDLPVAGSSI